MRGSPTLLRGLAAAAALAALAAAEPVRLSRTLGDHCVLQRDRNLVVWGLADPGAAVAGALDDASLGAPAVAGADGVWRLAVVPHAADSDGATHAFTFNASDGSSTSMIDVVFGDVFSAGGQSNMAFTVGQALNASAEEATADAYSPWLRVFTVSGVAADAPLVDLNGTQHLPWSRVNSTNVVDFTAIGFFFARALFNRIVAETGVMVPIGLISNNVGGTAIEYWVDDASLNACAGAPDAPYAPPYTNGTLFSGMIAPFGTGPTAMAGWLFYQAEANAPPYGDSPVWYACAFSQLIARWRSAVFRVDATQLWFGFVQLAPFIGPDGWEEVRQSQLVGGLAQPNVTYATMVDNGDPLSPFGSYHPRNKQLIAARLANAAVSEVYGLPANARWRAPELASASFSQTGDSVTVTAALSFVPASGVATVAAPCPTAEGVPQAICSDFSVWWRPAPAPNYTHLGEGFLAAGNDCAGGSGANLTIAEATAGCTAIDECVGFTYDSNSTDPGETFDVLFKCRALNFLPSNTALWQSFGSDRDWRGERGPASGAASGATVTITAAAPSTGQRAVAAGYGWSTWPLTPLVVDAGGNTTLPLIPFFATAAPPAS